MIIVMPTCARKEVVAVFVKRDSHDPVGEIKSLLHTVTMVYIYIYVQHPRMITTII